MSKKVKLEIERIISLIDLHINNNITSIRLNGNFESLHACWKGLYSILKFSAEKLNDPLIQFKLIDVSVDELSKQMLERILLKQAFHQPGCNPFSIILGDYYLENSHIKLLHNIDSISSMVFSPFVSSQKYPLTKSFKFEFIKIITPKVVLNDKHQTRINGIYLYIKQIIKAFAKTHWFYDINQLNIKQPHYPESEPSDDSMNALQKHRYRQLFGTHNDPMYKFEQTLAVSRVAHYIKTILRNKIGSYHTHQQCQDYLQNWLHQYCATFDKSVRYPLLRGRVKIDDHCTLDITPYFNQYNCNKKIRFKIDES